MRARSLAYPCEDRIHTGSSRAYLSTIAERISVIRKASADQLTVISVVRSGYPDTPIQIRIVQFVHHSARCSNDRSLLITHRTRVIDNPQRSRLHWLAG